MVARVSVHNRILLFTTAICKLFSYASIPTHALLASKRHPFDLQKMLFKTLTNALLKSN